MIHSRLEQQSPAPDGEAYAKIGEDYQTGRCSKMKLVKQQTEKPEYKLSKKYLIPSVLAMGVVPMIMHEHTYNTHLDSEDWFAVGNYTATDFFLFWKQWAVIIIALVCLLLLLIRAKYYFEELPWEKKAFVPALIYAAFVFISACFAKKPLFAFAGGYDMFQSALAILSYLVIFYYTYSCIRSEEHIVCLLRWSSYFILIEALIYLFQMLGHDPIATNIGKRIVTDPSRWSRLDSLTLSPDVYGTLYNVDYLSMFFPVLIPLMAALIILEKKLWRKIFSGIVLLISFVVTCKASSSAIIGLIGAVAIGLLIICSRNWKTLIACILMFAAIFFACYNLAFNSTAYIKASVKNLWDNSYVVQDSDVPIKKITTGNNDDGVTIELKDGRTIRFTYSIGGNNALTLNVWDGNGNPLEMTLTDENTQTYGFNDPAYSADMYFCRNDSQFNTCLSWIKDGRTFVFTKDDDGYYLVSTAGRNEKLPQKNKGEVYEVFSNGLWTGRGPIYNRSLPLLKKTMFVGAGADNFIMVYPQRDYIQDYYLNYGSNMINVKPHCYYLQVWIQEGFIAFAVVMVFFFWYLCRSARLYRKVDIHDKLGLTGFAVVIGVIAYLIAVIANDSNICTAPTFWTVLGLGWGINALVSRTSNKNTK